MHGAMACDSLVTKTGRVLFLDRGTCREGGFGCVYRAHFDIEDVPVAVKFALHSRPKGKPSEEVAELHRNEDRRFSHEISMLRKLNALARRCPNRFGHCETSHWIIPQQFPKFLGEGVYKGRRFYVMEWLEPVDFRDFRTEYERRTFAGGLCEAVGWLHMMGYVHCDLKPANIMRRHGVGVSEYVFVDFGSIHKKEEPLKENEERKNGRLSLSVDRNRVRYYPHTPGYADPIYDRHTIYFDIYSIGQVLRDMFLGDVPLTWSRIIIKCISHWWEDRYKSVEELSKDIDDMDVTHEAAYHDFKRLFDRRELDRQSSMEVLRWPEDFRKIKWKDILRKGRRPQKKGAVWHWDVDRIHAGLHDVTGEYVSLFSPRGFRIDEVLKLPPGVCLNLSGSFALLAPVIGVSSSSVVLSDGVCFHNSAAQGPGGDQSVYVVTSRAYLNFPKMNGRKVEDRDAILGRIFQSQHDVTHVGFSGPAGWTVLRKRESRRAAETALPEGLKKELVEYMETGGIGVDGKKLFVSSGGFVR